MKRPVCNWTCAHYHVTPMGQPCRCRKASRYFGPKDTAPTVAWCPLLSPQGELLDREERH
jgi:hypothetical protein